MSECHCPHMTKTEGKDEGRECGKSVCMCAQPSGDKKDRKRVKKNHKAPGNNDEDEEKIDKFKVRAITG